MTDLYTSENSRGSGASRPYAPSDTGEVETPVRQGGTGGVFREDQRARVVGRVFNKPKVGLFRYDVVHGRGANIQFAVSRDDRMSPAEAGEQLHFMHGHFGLEGESDALLYAFDRALMFCHTLNSGSTLIPGRSTFSIPSTNSVFEYGQVRKFLGNDMRRFFRAFADFTTTVNKQVIEAFAKDGNDPINAENYGLLMSIAADRNLHRYPYLAHDSADACLELTLAERMAVQSSKLAVISATPNAVDGTLPKQFIKSADGLNSTNGTNY